MAYDVLNFCTMVELEDGRFRVTVDPADLYPETIARIQEVLAWTDNHPPTEPLILNSAEEPMLPAARNINPGDWTLALTPRVQFADGDARLVGRAQALETALGWFMRSIRLAMAGKSYDTTITRDDDFKLR